ncbi:MAG: DivIVA domain-containing protein [Thermaerobacter sp.]|nr:DivIVA domain-containing protein [Thermaerobacter sp.]
MPLTPVDIYNKEFKRGFRGYQEDEVNEFLDHVVRDFEAALKENEDLRQQLSGIGERIEQYRKLEETLKTTLVVAQQAADDVRAAAERDAESVLRDANTRAAEIVGQAERQLHDYQEQLLGMRRDWDTFRARMRGMLQGQLSLLDEAHPGEVD